MTLLAILYKETLVLSRSRRAGALILAYLGFLSLVVLWNWPSNEVLTLAATSSRKLLYLIGIGQATLLLAMIPGLTAGSSILERETGRLITLQATHLSPWTIVIGKWIGSVLFALILLLTAIPIVMLGLILGTMDLWIVLKLYVHLLITIFWAGMTGIAISAIAKTGYSALMGSYIFIIAICVLTPVPTLLQFGGVGSEIARNISPLGSMLSLLAPDIWLLFTEPASGPSPLTIYATFCLGSSLLSVFVAWLSLRNPDSPTIHRHSQLINNRRDGWKRKLTFPFYLFDPQKRRRQIPPLMNPVFSRELRRRMLGQTTNFIRAICAVVIFSLILTLYSVLKTVDAANSLRIADSIRVVVIASQVVLLSLLAPPLSAPAISRERELGTIDVLRLTKLGPWKIVLGNWYYAIMVSITILSAAFPMWWVMKTMHGVQIESLYYSISVILMALICGTLAGLAASSLCRRSGTAIGVAYLFTIGILFGPLLPVVFSDSISPQLESRLLTLNPIVVSVRNISVGLFHNLIGPDSWKTTLGYLGVCSSIFISITWWRTARLFRSG